MYDSPEVFGSYRLGHDDEMVEEAQPSFGGSSIDIDELFKDVSEENAMNIGEAYTSTKEAVDSEEMATVDSKAARTTEAIIRPMCGGVDRPASGGENGESSGKASVSGLTTRGTRRLEDFLIFCDSF